MLKNRGDGLHLKDDTTFALLTMVSPHMVTMFNELDNLFGLDIILNGKSIGLKNHVSQLCDTNVEENSSRKSNRS
jgi:hypothetical protein